MLTGAPQACGYFGKLPARADFVSHRLGHDTVECWDAWLQQSLAVSQSASGAAWHDLFFAAPIWRFMLPGGACGAKALVGVVMPSVDSVGRCFPLMLAQEVATAADPIGLMAGSARWFAAAEALALDALGDGADPSILDRPLPPCGVAPWPAAANRRTRQQRAAADDHVGIWAALPLAAAAPALLGRLWRPDGGDAPAVWWTTGAEHMPPGLAVSPGLVPRRGFPALLDGLWAEHGWTVVPTGLDGDAALSDPGARSAAWDREA